MQMKGLVQIVASLAFSLTILPLVHADDQAATTVNPRQNCAAELGITLPVKGSGVKLTDEQRQKLWACVEQARQAAFEQCAQRAGMVRGQRPSEAQHEALHTCMVSQGFKHHPGPFHHGPHAQVLK